MDRSDFLEPGFDPSSLKVAELRGILHGHEVSFPSSAKKADLIQLFNENIVPKAADLLRDKSAVEPTGSGIIDAPPRRRTRSVSPAKSPSRQRSPKKESGATASASSSPRKATSRKTKTEPASSVILEQGPLLEAPKEMKSKVSSEVQSPVSPKKGKKKLSTKSIVDPNVQEKEEDLNSKSQAAAITVVGSPRKRGSKKNEKLSVKDAEKEDLIKGESIDSIKSKRESSPFSAENVFQQGSPKTSPKVAKSPKSSKKRSLQDLEDTLTPAKKRAPSKKLESSLNAAPSSSNIAEDNGKSPVRHFSNFPSSPEEPPKPQGSPQPHSQLMEDIPSSAFSSSSQRHSVPFAASMDISQFSTPDSTVSHTQTSQHTFTGKRLSFMPSLDNLRVSNQFLKQLQKEVGEFTDDDQMKPIDPNVEEETTEETELEKLKVEVEEENNKVEKKGIKVSTDTRSPTSAVSESTGISWTSFFVTILLTVATVYSVWWSKERFEIGYCDVNFLSHSQIEKGDEPIFEKYLDYIKPSCVACPNHATCYPNFKVVCEEDFVYRPNLFSLGGRLPLAPACLPDTEKQRRIQALAKHARLVLREQNAKAECGENVPAGIEESELHNILKNLKSPYLSDEDFEELWKNAVKDIEKDDEVIVRRIRHAEKGYSPSNTEPDIIVTKKILQSKSLANISFECRIRRAARGLLVRYSREASILVSSFVLLWGLKWYLKTKRAYKEKVDKLVRQSLLQLSAQQKLADEDTAGKTVRFIAVSSLRDSILPGAKSTDKIWNDVTSNVESHTNVRSRNTEIHGEIMKIWEWIGGEVN